MARRKKNSRHARRHGNPRRAHRNRKARRGFRLFNKRRHNNPALEGIATALIAGGAGYVVTKGIGIVAERYLPQSVPQRQLVGVGLSAFAAVYVSERFLSSKPKVSSALTVGAMIPFAEEIIKMSPLGPYLGMYETESHAGSASGAMLPAPGGMSERLAASLSAGFEDSWSPADY